MEAQPNIAGEPWARLLKTRKIEKPNWPHPSPSNEWAGEPWVRLLITTEKVWSPLQRDHSSKRAKKSEMEPNWPLPSPTSCNCSQPWLPHAVIALQTRKSVQILLFHLKIHRRPTCQKWDVFSNIKSVAKQTEYESMRSKVSECCTWMLNDAASLLALRPPDKRRESEEHRN